MSESTQYITTMVVDAWPLDKWPGLPVAIAAEGVTGACGEDVFVDRATFDRCFHPLDRQIFHFALAVECMRMGLAVRRKGWSELAPSITFNPSIGEIVYAKDRTLPVHSLRGSCIAAEDWVVDAGA